MPLDDEILGSAKQARDRLIAAQHEVDDEEARPLWLRRPVGRLGHSGYAGPLAHRFNRDARDAVAAAQAAARSFDHEEVGSEDVLIGLLTVEEGGAAIALRALGIEA